MIENYKFKYRSRGKFIYAPNRACDRRAEQVVDFIERRVEFPEHFYHFKSGGHVAALHDHLDNGFFFKIDIQNFFYSIARNRVHRALASWGMKGAPTFARWSTVRSPYETGPRYVLPIGFKQSPHVASLVLMQSPVATAIDEAKSLGVTMSVYLDDIIGSHDDAALLTTAYERVRQACIEANLVPNADKLVAPTQAMVAFNCNLTKGMVSVTDARIAKFYAEYPSPASRISFEAYVDRVASANGGQA